MRWVASLKNRLIVQLSENERGLQVMLWQCWLVAGLEKQVVDVGMTRVVISVATRYCHQGRKGKVVTAGREAFDKISLQQPPGISRQWPFSALLGSYVVVTRRRPFHRQDTALPWSRYLARELALQIFLFFFRSYLPVRPPPLFFSPLSPSSVLKDFFCDVTATTSITVAFRSRSFLIDFFHVDRFSIVLI